VQTLHPILKRGVMIWDRAALPEALFRGRLAAAQQAITAAGQDAWLVYGDALSYGDVAFLTNYLPRVRSAMLLVPREGEPSLLVAFGLRDIPAAKTLTWVDDVRPFTRLPGEVAKLVQERGLERGRIGLAGVEELMPAGEWEQIESLLPEVEWLPTDGTLGRMRATKTAEEVVAVARAAAIVRAGLDRAALELRPGLTERQLLAEVDRELRYGGAEDARLLVASGPRASRALRPADDRALAAGDTVLLYLAAEYQRYWAEAGQTFVLGTADAETRQLAATAGAAVAAMLAVASTGATAGAAVDAAVNVTREAHDLLGTAPSAPSDTYGLGHGIGLDIEEPPYLRAGDETPLIEGATLALHVVLHGRDGRGAIVGQTVQVGAASAQPLVPLPAGVVEVQGLPR